MSLQLEMGEVGSPTRCECCGRESRTVHGFLCRDGDAYALYYAGWSDGHLDRGVTMAIAIGKWDDNSDASDRVSIGLTARATESEIQFTVLNPEESPWRRTALLGEMVPREEALVHPILKDVFRVAEHIVAHDSRIAAFLGQKSN